MRRQFMIILSVFMITLLTACSGSAGRNFSSTKEDTESSKVNNETDDSWTEYDTRSEAETAAGFSFSFGDAIVNGTYHEKEFRVKDGILEVSYVKTDSTDSEDQYVIRQGKKTTEDISEDSNSYSHDFTLDDCGINQIRLRGTKNSLVICSFDYDNYSYVIYPGSMDYEETFVVISELTGLKSTEFTSDGSEDTVSSCS